MMQPHLRDLGFPRNKPTQRLSVFGKGNRDLRHKEVQVDKFEKIRKNEPSSTFKTASKSDPTGEACIDSEQFIMTNQLLKNLFQWSMAYSILNLES
ncbi:hypothetical protein O181_106955 [Austropuccinia psidii MF-1]|uniref:Uncharacterized protein n=1 Tax=Austropuccinia psidii MF-1 TaxID=1389203 RepID=A0A9Q3JPK8_9BASI|nr:hypothetical protein [Austropuccinia psidii MF-1]